MEARSEKENVKEMNRGQAIKEKSKMSEGRASEEDLTKSFKPFPSNSLAFELD